MLTKEILSKAREEVSQQCMEDLANEISKKQAQIDKFTKANKKPVVDYTITKKI